MTLRVVTGTYTYPADKASLALARGRVSQLSEADRLKVKFKTVGPGDRCDDMPAESAAVYLERGWIVREDGTED